MITSENREVREVIRIGQFLIKRGAQHGRESFSFLLALERVQLKTHQFREAHYGAVMRVKCCPSHQQEAIGVTTGNKVSHEHKSKLLRT